MNQPPILSVIIPVYNEKNTIKELVSKVDSIDLDVQIIMVDDGSTDGSTQIIKKVKTTKPLIKKFHDINKGKGSAIRTGLEEATGSFTVIQDADLEYNPKDLEVLIYPVLKDKTNVVYGSRFKYAQRGIYSSRFFYLGGKFVTQLANLLFGLEITDEPTCYKLIKTDLLKNLNLECTGFEFCPEVTAKLGLRGEKIIELPISYQPRSVKQGKKINWKDGLVAIQTLLKYKFFPPNQLVTGLHKVSQAENYNNWIFSQFCHYIKGNVLEIGGGIGTFSSLIAPRAQHLDILEVDEQYHQQLKNKFKSHRNVEPWILDLSQVDQAKELPRKYDLVVLINTLEHVKNQEQMIQNIKKILKSRGKIFIFVPAHQRLYSRWDKSVSHYRRYNHHSLSQLLKKNDFKIIKSKYFNIIGAFGWYLNKLLCTTPSSQTLSGQISIFDQMIVPLMKLVEKSIKPPFGQSVYIIAGNEPKK